MYGEDEIHTRVGSAEDMVLMIVTETAYIALPVVWIWLVSSFTGPSVSGVNSLLAYAAGKLDSSVKPDRRHRLCSKTPGGPTA